jgi:hypothetical protein
MTNLDLHLLPEHVATVLAFQAQNDKKSKNDGRAAVAKVIAKWLT